MCLRSYSFHKELSGNVCYELFKDALAAVDGVYPAIKLDYAFDVIEAVVDRGLKPDENFNIFYYCQAIKRNQFLNKLVKSSKELSIRNEYDEPEDYSNSISESSLTSDSNAYNDLIGAMELEEACSALRKYNEEVFIFYEVNILLAMRQALGGVTESIQTLKEICRVDEKLAGYIRVILSNGVSTYGELFPEYA